LAVKALVAVAPNSDTPLEVFSISANFSRVMSHQFRRVHHIFFHQVQQVGFHLLKIFAPGVLETIQ